MHVIEATRDVEGIQLALSELLEEGFALSRLDATLATADEATRARLSNVLPPRTLSPGYYKLGEYLLWLHSVIESAVPPNALRSFEAEGLRALRDARREFESKHPPCGACGARQENRFAPACCECGVKFTRE